MPIVGPAPHRDLCTGCGISRSAEPERRAKAREFIRPDCPDCPDFADRVHRTRA